MNKEKMPKSEPNVSEKKQREQLKQTIIQLKETEEKVKNIREQLSKTEKEIKELLNKKARLEDKGVPLAEKRAAQLIEQLNQEYEGKLKGYFLGSKEIQNAFVVHYRGGTKESLIADYLPELPLPKKEKISETVEIFRELGITKWALVRMISQDKDDRTININWLNEHFKIDPKDRFKPISEQTKLVSSNGSLFMESFEKNIEVIKKEPLSDKWAIVALEYAEDSAMTDKTDQQQIELIRKINHAEKLNIFTLSAGDSLYTLVATYLAIGHDTCLDPRIYLRTASYFEKTHKCNMKYNDKHIVNYNVQISCFDKNGISIIQASLDDKDIGRVLAIE